MVELLPAPSADQQAVVALTGHAYLLTGSPPPWPLTAFGAETHPGLLLHLAGDAFTIGCLDVLLVATGSGAGGPPRLPADTEHPRIGLARAIRRQVEVFGDDRGVVTLAAGLAGRRELSIDATLGAGGSLLRDALGLLPAGAPVFAAVSPGNARSLRAFLRTGFRPLGSEVMLHRSSLLDPAHAAP